MAVDASPAAGDTPGQDGPSSRDIVATLAGQYSFSPKNLVAAFSGKSTIAIAASDRRLPSDESVALVCSPDVVPRVEAMAALKGLSKPGALALKDFGPIDWADGKQRLAVVYDAAPGGRFTPSGPMPPWQIIDAFLKPVSQALVEVHGRAVMHRAIRPDNLYLAELGSPMLALGPCVTVPPGYEQPDIYEPIETAAADPAGRSDGTPRHDMFALGMTVMGLMLGREPGAGIDRDDLMIRRIELGSLAAVIDPTMVPPEIADPLRGLLTDTAAERWTLKDLNFWLKGGKVDPPRIAPQVLAAKPFTIGGKQVRCARSLAYMIGRHWAEGAKALRSEELVRWLRQDAADATAASFVEQVLRQRDPEDGGFDNDVLLAARAVMALDPMGPIRYHGVATDPYGLGPFLFDATRTPEKVESAISMIDQGLPQKIVDMRPVDRRRATRQAINFERLRRWITSPQAFEGLERCLYDLNPHLPCRSPMVEGKWITRGSEIVAQLDKVANAKGNAEIRIDNSTAAFLAARLDADGYTLMALMTPEAVEEDVLLDAIRLFADEQVSLGSRPLPGIARWSAKLAMRIAESIHHRPTRKELTARVEAAIPEGNITAVYKALAIDGLKDADNRGFDAAKTGWERLESEIWAIEREAERLRLNALRRGRDNVPVAAGAGGMLAFLLTLFTDALG